MAILGSLLKKGIKLREILAHEYATPFELQRSELKELLNNASDTKIGKHYNFSHILSQYKLGSKNFYEAFKKIPIHNYEKMYNDWWRLSLKGEKNICWPGRIKYFALSSGTSTADSKHIPITKDMTKAIRRTSSKQILSLSRYDLEPKVFESGILMIGGSTHLNKRESYYEGDLTGIQASQLPFWFQHFYKPGKKIAKTINWDTKLDQIAKKATSWDIGIIVGIPSWIQILIEKILALYQVDNIHKIWPNLIIYVHGGVAFDPYRKGFAKLLGKPIHYIETYLASEGFIAYQNKPNQGSMTLVLKNGLFYEFIPFDNNNFSDTGQLQTDVTTLMIDDVEVGKEYALVISTCAGAWRYLIGDVIRFVSVEECTIVITGRTNHYLNICGEHLSIDNMNKAIELVSNELQIVIKEFTVAIVQIGTLFGHHWYLGTNDKPDSKAVKKRLDFYLKKLNADYATERNAGLKDIFVDILPEKTFYDWMESRGKLGGQNKFPRVLKNPMLVDWQKFIKTARFE